MEMTSDDKVTYFAETDARNKKIKFGIKAKDRTRHVYVIGKTGMGKSTLLENMAVQDIQNGEGLAFIDPHGKTADLLLNYVPENRIKDVVYFAPFDVEYPVSFNVMEDVGYDKRHLVVSGLMSTFKKIWLDAWSARMEYILTNTLLALLEYPGATLLGVNKMLSDKEYRKKVVANIGDPSVKSFWVDEFAKYTDKFAAEATPAIQNKIGQFTNNPLIRNIIGQPKSSFDIRKMMDERKIIIINLSKGRVGESNANLLGAMFITKIYLAAMSRADTPEKVLRTLPNFYLYVDEFQSFANESFADILSEARKYKLNLTIAHQYIEQMSEEVRAAVFGNVGTMIAFRIGSFDAEILEKEFAPKFTAEDIVNLGFAQIYLRLMIDGIGSQPFSATTLPPIPEPPISFYEQVIQSSRAAYGQLRSIVEEQVKLQTIGPDKPAPAPIPSPASAPASAPAFAQTPALVLPSALPARPAYTPRMPQQSQTQDRWQDRRPPQRQSTYMDSRSPQQVTFENRQSMPSRPALQNPTPAPASAQSRQAPPPDESGGFLNIADLKKNRTNKPEKKAATPEAKADLKQALEAIMKKQSIPPQPQKNSPQNSPLGQIKEVPEEVLKKVLDV